MTYEKCVLYQFNGTEFVRIEPSIEQKIPVTDDAMQAVRDVRKAAHQLIGLRPDLSMVGSAMVLAAAELPDVAVRVKTFIRQFVAD